LTVALTLARVPEGSEELAKWPYCALLAPGEEGGKVAEALALARSGVRALQYCFDYEPYVNSLRRVMNEYRVHVQALLDAGQFERPSSRQQATRILELLRWGAEIRTSRPTVSRYSSMHAKLWLVDGCVAVMGSANATRNSLENNAELVVVTRVDSVIQGATARFRSLWETAQPVDVAEYAEVVRSTALRRVPDRDTR
jgi:phosphatidylserine/phosphatidylglycerophosphate/cardiolipin synthase-like enzyme